jgi:hypothetical protein
MKPKSVMKSFVAVLLIAAGFSALKPGVVRGGSGGDIQRKLNHGGRERSYILHVPAKTDPFD